MTTMLRSPAVASRVGVSEDTLKRWRRRTRSGDSTGPTFVETETGTVLYPEDQLEQWIKDRTVIA